MKNIASFEIKKYLKSISEYISDNGIKKMLPMPLVSLTLKKNSISWISGNELECKNLNCAILVVPKLFPLNH